QTVTLDPGDVLLCVTDGVTERREGARMLGDDRFTRTGPAAVDFYWEQAHAENTGWAGASDVPQGSFLFYSNPWAARSSAPVRRRHRLLSRAHRRRPPSRPELLCWCYPARRARRASSPTSWAAGSS
ncbi:SpoIIE family protein phosphatase, partial [Streptomyces sp. NPDC006307]|uniref:SpoIIE family protein phosphatase n=1 Tax=Streptomyces sp. NPDC006307 TaxID=3156748 RepID=UPI0033A56E35